MDFIDKYQVRLTKPEVLLFTNVQKMWKMNSNSKTEEFYSRFPFTCSGHCGWTCKCTC